MASAVKKHTSKFKYTTSGEGTSNMPKLELGKNFSFGIPLQSRNYFQTLVECYDDVLKMGYGLSVKFNSYPYGKIIQIEIEAGPNLVRRTDNVSSLNEGMEKFGIKLVDENKKDIQTVVGTKIIVDGDQTIIIKNIENLQWDEENAKKDFKAIMSYSVPF